MDKHLNTADIEAFIEETGLDGPVVKELYQVFLEELTSEKKELLGKLSLTDYVGLAKIVHNIKGISGSYRLPVVMKLSKELDASLKRKDYTDIDKGILELIKNITLAEAEIGLFIRS